MFAEDSDVEGRGLHQKTVNPKSEETHQQSSQCALTLGCSQNEPIQDLKDNRVRSAHSGLLGEDPSLQPAILPLTKFEGWENWSLPGHGTRRESCGVYVINGCLETANHSGFNGRSDTVYLKRVRWHCNKPSCPVCYESWSSKEAHVIARKFRTANLLDRVIHGVASVPNREFKSYRQIRSEVQRILRRCGVKVACLIFHPFRERCLQGCKPSEEVRADCKKKNHRLEWYWSPHFHFLADTYSINWLQTKGVYAKTGWFIKNLGLRESVYATAMYQLSHAGVFMAKPRTNTVSWFGYKSLLKNLGRRVPTNQENLCPLCGSKLRLISFNSVSGIGDPPISTDESCELNEVFVDLHVGGMVAYLYESNVFFSNYSFGQNEHKNSAPNADSPPLRER